MPLSDWRVFDPLDLLTLRMVARASKSRVLDTFAVLVSGMYPCDGVPGVSLRCCLCCAVMRDWCAIGVLGVILRRMRLCGFEEDEDVCS
jgi:hypothetical protein